MVVLEFGGRRAAEEMRSRKAQTIGWRKEEVGEGEEEGGKRMGW